MPHRRTLLPVLAALLGVLPLSGPAAAAPVVGHGCFAAMGHDRFAVATGVPGGVMVRCLGPRSSSDDKASVIFTVGYSHLVWDDVSQTLLLITEYEDSAGLVSFAPDGQELGRLGPGGADAIFLIPSAGQFAAVRGDSLLVHDCRTGLTIRRLALATNGDHLVGGVVPLGGDLLLFCCSDAAGQQAFVAMSWRDGAERWRRQAGGWSWLAGSQVADDAESVYLIDNGPASATDLVALARDSGRELRRVRLPDTQTNVVAPAGQPWLLVHRGTGSRDGGKIELRDRATLAVLRSFEAPVGVVPGLLRFVKEFDDGRLLLGGTFYPKQEPDAPRLEYDALLLTPGSEPPAARALPGPLAIDPDGQAWLLRWRPQELGGEAPWPCRVELDPTRPWLPEAVLNHREDRAPAHGPSHFSRNLFRPDSAPPGEAAFDALLAEADLCFAGTLTAVAWHCLCRGGSAEDGLAVAWFTRDEPLWGPSDAVPVYIDGFGVPGCIEFAETTRPTAERFVPGRRYLVAARHVDGSYVVRGPGLFALDADASAAEAQDGFTVADPLARARTRARRLDPRDQFARADLVLVVAPLGEGPGATDVAVERALKGPADLCRLNVAWIADDHGHARWLHQGLPGEPPPDGDYLVFLRSCGAGRAELLEGRWSALRRASYGPGGLRRDTGLPAPEADAVLDEH